MYTLRFDLRSPAGGAPRGDLYRAALEMTSWAEDRGAIMALVSEHHGLDDGYLPSPLILATALAARTTKISIMTAVIVLPLYEPIRLAEDLIVLDILSGGRVSFVGAVGYRPEEYELHGVDFHRRGRIAEEHLNVLLRAKSGESFEHNGQTFRLTPEPVTVGGPTVAWGGGSVAAARRAGRHGLDFFGQRQDPALASAYEEEARRHGHTPGWCFLPPADLATTVFVADDLDRAWDELGPYLIHDATSYAAMNEGDVDGASFSFARSVDELRAENRSHRILTVEQAVEMARVAPLPLHPLVGGLPPELAWRYLRTVGDEVMPALSEA